jgi:type II secretory pathway predicted ATPase ExeA
MLVVVARPARDNDLPYSHFVRNLVAAIDRSKYAVYLHVLSCGTYEALCNHLRDCGTGFYDIIHLDVHGGRATYNDLKRGIVFDKNSLDIKPIIPGSGNDVDNPNIVKVANLADYETRNDKIGFEGEKMFLFFEAGEKHFEIKQTCAIDIDRFVRQTNSSNVYMMTFGCSSKQPNRVFIADDNQYCNDFLFDVYNYTASAIVVGPTFKMPYRQFNSFTVEMYSEIFKGRTIGDALRFSRKNKESSKNLFFLPIMLGNGDVKFELESSNDPTQECLVPDRYFMKDFKMVGKSKTTELIGRDRDFYFIERILLTDQLQNMLHIKGPSGIGKTLLMQKLGMHWRATNSVVKKILYYEFKTNAGDFTMEKLINNIAAELDIDSSYIHQIKMQAIIDKFRSQRYLLILDDLDLLTNQLTTQQKNEFQLFIRRLQNLPTIVMVASQNNIKWLTGSSMSRLMDTYELWPLNESEQKDMILYYFDDIRIDPSILNESVYKSIDEKTKGNPALLKNEIGNFCKPKKISLAEFAKMNRNNYFGRY